MKINIKRPKAASKSASAEKAAKTVRPIRAKPQKETEHRFPVFVGMKFDQALIDRIDHEAERRDVSRSVLIRDLMDKAVP